MVFYTFYIGQSEFEKALYYLKNFIVQGLFFLETIFFWKLGYSPTQKKLFPSSMQGGYSWVRFRPPKDLKVCSWLVENVILSLPMKEFLSYNLWVMVFQGHRFCHLLYAIYLSIYISHSTIIFDIARNNIFLLPVRFACSGVLPGLVFTCSL